VSELPRSQGGGEEALDAMPRAEKSVQSREIRLALLISWGIVSAIGVCCCLLPYVVDGQRLQSVFPACPAGLAGHPCAMCGMTRAFIAIAGGRLAQATRLNTGAPAVYYGFLANTLILLVTLSLARRRTSRKGAAVCSVFARYRKNVMGRDCSVGARFIAPNAQEGAINRAPTGIVHTHDIIRAAANNRFFGKSAKLKNVTAD
jgi:hypothetical protein